MPVTEVPTSSATVAIETFMTELSRVMRNCAAASVSSTMAAPLAATGAARDAGVDAEGATTQAWAPRRRGDRALTRGSWWCLPVDLGLLLDRGLHLLGVLLALLLRRLGRTGSRLLGDLLAAIDSLGRGLLGLLLDLCGHRPELLVLDVGRRDQHADQEPAGERGYAEADRIRL